MMTRVLFSRGFGAGIGPDWNDAPRCDDPVLVTLYNRGATKEEVEEAFPEAYWGGWGNVTHIDVPEGSWWRIEEYDGSEHVEVIDHLEKSSYTQA
jgi:hypothetical protein